MEEEMEELPSRARGKQQQRREEREGAAAPTGPRPMSSPRERTEHRRKRRGRGGEDEDEWAEWYAEMAQYEGWERGEGSNMAGSLVVVDPSIPADVAQVLRAWRTRLSPRLFPSQFLTSSSILVIIHTP